MKKILLTIEIISLCIFTVGLGLRLSNDRLVSDIGLWIQVVSSFIMAVIAISICIVTFKNKKSQNDLHSKEENDNTTK